MADQRPRIRDEKLRQALRILPDPFTSLQLWQALTRVGIRGRTRPLERLLSEKLIESAGTQKLDRLVDGKSMGGRPVNVYRKRRPA